MITELETPTGPMSASAKAALIGTTAPQRVGNLEANGPQLGHPAPVVYEGTLTNGHPAGAGNAVYQGRLESANWDYWQFCATAGSTVVLETHRTSSAMDPAHHVYFGTTPTAEGLVWFGAGTNPYMTFLAFDDDNNGRPHDPGGSFADPRTAFVAPSSGLYTLAVWDFFGAGPADANGEVPYDILASGLGGSSPIAVGAGADTDELWPPNHKMHTVVVTVGASGGCGALNVAVAVSSDEPIDGTGDGDTAPDWSAVTDNGDGTFSVDLRAERAGNGDGRTYTITATATDATGASSSASATVDVPHSKGKKK